MMGKINSISKGKVGEREFANLLKANGFKNARRGQQFNGLEGDDVVGVPNVHIEVKRVEKLNLEVAMEQSIRDADGKIPIVAHRRNGKPWKITMLFDDYINYLKLAQKVYNNGDELVGNSDKVKVDSMQIRD